MAEMSADSNKSRNMNFTYKISDGDLSADMFFENTEKSDSTQGFVHVQILIEVFVYFCSWKS